MGETLKKAAFLLAFFLAAAAAPAWAADWHDKSNYPARAISITFPSGVLDANHSVRFGAWTVSFDGGALPIMELRLGGISVMSLTADSNPALTCANSVSGTFSCYFTLTIGTPGSTSPFMPDHDTCAFTTQQNGKDILPVGVPCPNSIAFQY
jgi:hypothetical protein